MTENLSKSISKKRPAKPSAGDLTVDWWGLLVGGLISYNLASDTILIVQLDQGIKPNGISNEPYQLIVRRISRYWVNSKPERKLLVRKFLIAILLMGGAATVSADCTQADLAGWWDYHDNNVSCDFLLDEDGYIQKGNCSSYALNFEFGVPWWELSDKYWEEFFLMESNLGRIGIVHPFQDANGANIVVDDHCKVKGAFYYCTGVSPCSNRFGAPRTTVILMDGRLNVDKSIVSGVAGLWHSGTRREYQAAYTMTKF